QAEVNAVHAAWCAVGVPGCPPSPQNLSLSPANVKIDEPGQTQQLTATLVDDVGQALPGVAVTFTSEGPAVATVQPATTFTNTQGKATATVTAVSDGNTGIKAEANGKTARAPVEVPAISPLGMVLLALLALGLLRRRMGRN
ncbi:MAG: hypothetical protein GY778_18475, partial [bacterium]|nr:hypothetical protein [bacterium]